MGDPLILTLAGCAMTVMSAMLLYGASPHQQAGPMPFSPAVAVWLGGALLVAGVALMLVWSGWAVAVFAPLTILMTVWSIVPLIIGWRRYTRKDRA